MVRSCNTPLCLAFTTSLGLTACAGTLAPKTEPAPEAPETETRTAVTGETEGPRVPPPATDWAVESDDLVPLGDGMSPSNIAFSPKGDRLVLSAWQRRPKAETRDAELLFVPLASPTRPERIKVDGTAENGELRVAWSHDGRTVAYSGGTYVRTLDVQSGKTRLLVEWKGTDRRWVKNLSFSPDDKRIAALVTRPSGVRYAVNIIRTKDGDVHEYLVTDQTVELAGWSAGESIALVEWDRKPGQGAKKRIDALDLETGKRDKWALPRGLDAAAAYTSGGLFAVDPSGVVWQLEEGRWSRRFAVGHKLVPTRGDAGRDTLTFDAVGLSPDNRYAVIAEVDADGTGGAGILRVLKLRPPPGGKEH